MGKDSDGGVGIRGKGSDEGVGIRDKGSDVGVGIMGKDRDWGEGRRVKGSEGRGIIGNGIVDDKRGETGMVAGEVTVEEMRGESTRGGERGLELA